MSILTEKIKEIKDVTSFSITSHCHKSICNIRFSYKSQFYNVKKVNYNHIYEGLLNFDGTNIDVFVKPKQRKVKRQPESVFLKRQSDILLYTDELDQLLSNHVKMNPLDKYAKFLYYAINAEKVSLLAKSNSDLYAEKTELLTELINISNNLDYKVHVIDDDSVSVKFKLFIIVLDDCNKLAYHSKDINLDYTNDFVLDETPIHFTEYLIEEIKKVVF